MERHDESGFPRATFFAASGRKRAMRGAARRPGSCSRPCDRVACRRGSTSPRIRAVLRHRVAT